MYQQRMRFGPVMSGGVKVLLIFLVTIFLFQQLIGLFRLDRIFILFFGLNYQGLVQNFWIWQLFTYMFLHGGFFHILFNGFALWMFGSELERLWGIRRFINYFLLSGIGAGIFIALMNLFVYSTYQSVQNTTIGASGAIYALLLAYGITWPNREVYVYFLFPVKIKYLVIIFGIIEFFGTLNTMAGIAGNISHIGHLGGLIAGFFLLQKERKILNFDPKSFANNYFKKKRINKKKNEVEQRIKAKKIIDRLLDKISKTGINSLTPEEQREFEWARRHYYPSNNDTIH
jgi:membrane associated rhomboid family serine protease